MLCHLHQGMKERGVCSNTPHLPHLNPQHCFPSTGKEQSLPSPSLHCLWGSLFLTLIGIQLKITGSLLCAKLAGVTFLLNQDLRKGQCSALTPTTSGCWQSSGCSHWILFVPPDPDTGEESVEKIMGFPMETMTEFFKKGIPTSWEGENEGNKMTERFETKEKYQQQELKRRCLAEKKEGGKGPQNKSETEIFKGVNWQRHLN